MNAFSRNLIELRKLNKLTQRDVARHLGISQPAYTRYENGKSEPTIENLIKLADLFDVSIDFLCGRVSY